MPDERTPRVDHFQLGIKALIRNSEGQALLLKVNLEELKGYEGSAYWDIPGGRIHRGGTIEETIRREVLEETGIKDVSVGRFIGAAISNIRIPISSDDDVGLVLFAYECRATVTSTIKLSAEHTDFGWFSIREVAELLAAKYPSGFTDSLRGLQ